MKKRHLIWIIPSGLVVLLLLISLFGHLLSPAKGMKMPKESKNKTMVTEKEMKEDLKYLKYYFENMYAGYHLLEEQGFSMDDINSKIMEKSKQDMHGGKIEVSVFRNRITEVMFENLKFNDMHLSINGRSFNRKSLYFSDVYVQEKLVDGVKKYFICKNERDPYPDDIKKNMNLLDPADVKIGAEYTGPVSNLYECYVGQEKLYRYCVFTNKSVAKAYMNIDGQNVWVPIMPSLSISTTNQHGFAETDDTLYISFSDFVFHDGNEMMEEMGKRQFQQLCDNAKNLSKGKKNLIIDLRNNGGGDPFRRNAVFAYLLYNQQELSKDTLKAIESVGQEEEIRMISPAMASLYRSSFYYRVQRKFKLLKFKKNSVEYDYEQFEKSEYKDWFKINNFYGFADLLVPQKKMIREFAPQDNITLPEPDFKGDIYILTNRYSASCSEYSMALAHEFEKFDGIKVHHLGENTCGAVEFVNPCSVILPNCGGWIYMPTAYNGDSKAFKHSDFHGEGEGWYPEYWVSSFQLSDLLCHLIGDEKLEETLKGIERRHL